MVLKWGIVSAGKISNDFVMALKTLPETQHAIIAIAARDITRAKEFARTHEIEKYYGNYIDLSKDPNIDIVYIGAINPCHYDIAMLMMNNNKHVLCEKPLAMNPRQTSNLIITAVNKKLLLVDGIWSRFFPVYDHIKTIIYSQGLLGDVREVTVSFGFDLSNVDRLTKKELGGGVTMDLGVYCLQFALHVYNDEKPSVEASGDLNVDGVDTRVSATLTFSEGRTAKITMDSSKQLANEAIIDCENGVITIPQFWCPTQLTYKTKDSTIPEKTVKCRLPTFKKKTNFINSIGFIYEIQEIREYFEPAFFFPELEDKEMYGLEKMPYKTSAKLAGLMRDIRMQLHVEYPADKNPFGNPK